MRRISTIFIIIALFSINEIFASTKGILKGKVLDPDGKPAIGAKLEVKGSGGRGLIIKDKDGSYTLTNIPSGRYTVSIRLTGVPEYKKEVTISADAETILDVKLVNSTTGEVIKYGNKEQTSTNTVATQKIYDEKDLRGGMTSDGQSIAAQTAGVNMEGSGISVRNLRPEDTKILVDGIDLSNKFTGGNGRTDAAHTPQISQFGLAEAQMLSGNNGAQYGGALGGVFNSVVNVGNTERYQGYITFRTDVPSLNGSQRLGTKVIKEGKDYKAYEQGPGLKLMGKNLNDFAAGINGPIPFLENSTFALNASNITEQFRNNSYNLVDSRGYNWGQIADNRSWVKNLDAKFQFGILPELKLTIGTSYGSTNMELGNTTWLYNHDTPPEQYKTLPDGSPNPQYGVPENIAKQPVLNQVISKAYVRINHTLTPTSYYEITISQNSNNDEYGRRVGNETPGYFSGFKLYRPIDKLQPKYSNSKKETILDTGVNNIVDIYENYTNNRFSDDGLFQNQFQARNPLTGYYEGIYQNSGTNSAFGVPAIFSNHGNITSDNSPGFSFRYGSYFEVKADYSNIFKDGLFDHAFTAGFTFNQYKMELNQNTNPFEGRPTTDVYTDQYGGNIYGISDELKKITNKAKTPSSFNIYVEDKIRFKDLTFYPGIVLDYFNPNSNYRTFTKDFVGIDETQYFANTTAKFNIAPRIGLNYRITTTQNLKINYGVYYSTPPLQRLYDGANTLQLRSGGEIIGNPNMGPQKVNKYEVVYENQLNDTYSFTLSPYYSDIFKQLGLAYVPSVPIPFWITKVAEYGTNKGIEFVFRKAETNNFGFNFNYTISRTTGTANNVESNTASQIDTYTGNFALPLSEYVLERDITHTAKLSLNFVTNKEQGPILMGSHIFENMGFLFVGSYRSGTPYTSSQVGGVPTSERNSFRYPSQLSFNLRISKRIIFADFFDSSSAGKSQLEIYLQINNLFNFTPPVALYSVTHDPLDNGSSLEKQIGNFQDIAYYRDGKVGKPETVSINQYDIYGQRLYSTEADFDHNGVVTQAETYQSYINYLDFVIKRKPNYQAPRQIYFGLNFTF